MKQQRMKKNAENGENIIESTEISKHEAMRLTRLRTPLRRIHVTVPMRESERVSFGSRLDHDAKEKLHEKMIELHLNLNSNSNSNAQCRLVKMKIHGPGAYNWLNL